VAAKVCDAVVVGTTLVRFLEEQPNGDIAGQVRWLKSEM
jgi:tryptophan synthase alpha subunit